MKKYLVFMSILFSINVSAQNLVNNWSFEDTVACPDNVGQLDRAVGWMSFGYSPDYFNSCADAATYVSVPSNFSGYRFPRTGNAYGGFITGSSRESIGTLLNQSLNVGQTYYVSFFLCRGGSRKHATNKIGIHLSTVLYSSISPISINNISQVYTDSIISDTINWTKISGSFIADSTYQYLSIGNFFNDSLTTYISFDSIPLYGQAYYYLEDVKLSADSSFVNGIENQYEFTLVKVFPNPAKDWILIEGGNIKSIEIFDLYGRLVVPKMTVSSFKTQVDISTLSQSIYTVKISTQKNDFLKKLIHL